MSKSIKPVKPTKHARPASSRGIIFTQLAVEASLGIHPHEKQRLQRVVIDLVLALDPKSEPRSDTIAATLDYDGVRQGILAIAQKQHYDLQETLARRILDYVMALSQVIGAKVVISKPDAYGDCEAVSYYLVAGAIE